MQPDVEIWKPVPGWAGCYEVSSWGRVKRIESCEGAFARRVRSETTRRLRPEPRQISQLELHRDGYRRCYTVASLVAKAFLPPPPRANCRVRHIDGNPHNNRANNLCWAVSPKQAAQWGQEVRELNAKILEFHERVEAIRNDAADLLCERDYWSSPDIIKARLRIVDSAISKLDAAFQG